MASTKRLIVGLGNPGAEYEQTRHNVGFWVVDALSDRARAELKPDRGPALAGCGRLRGRPVCFVKPLSYMNLSGGPVRHHMVQLGVSLQDLLVVVDDINLEPGVIRLRRKGSAGGHNGVQSIIDVLKTEDFPRLRIGIGSNFNKGQQAKYVLSPFNKNEIGLIDDAVLRAREATTNFVCEGIVTAMNRINKK
ncbi:MAG: aminoacyl-tRNA hydrolase [Rhodothermales bacterium]